ncbi:hypothetical protein WIA86_28835 [Klebsiella pneumoniae]
MPALEIILRLALQLFGNGIQNHRLAPQYQVRQLLSPWSTSSNLKNLRQGHAFRPEMSAGLTGSCAMAI